MAGIFFADSGSNPSFDYLHPLSRTEDLGLPKSPYFFSVPSPFTICSSSCGLLLCRDLPTGAYHILNPFIPTPNSYRRLPPASRNHQPDAPAVLAVDLRHPANPIFHIICAVQEGRSGRYTFDTYSSDINMWLADEEDEGPVADIGFGRHILPSSGVANGRGMAYWLTSVPHAVVEVKIDVAQARNSARMIMLPSGLNGWAKLQLGRMEENVDGVALVASSTHNVRLYVLRRRGSTWFEKGSLSVGDDGGALLEAEQQRPVMQKPEVMRFEGGRVPLFTGDGVVVWEVISNEKQKLHRLQTWTTISPSNVGQSVPYTPSKLVAADFLEIMNENEDDR